MIAMITTGPFIQFCLPYGEKFVNLLVNEKDVDAGESVTATA